MFQTQALPSRQSYKQGGRYSSCRYNERQLIDVTVVRRVRPRERSCDCEGHRRWKRAGRTLFCHWFGRASAAERVLSQDPCCCRRRTASGFACPSCTAGNCVEKGWRRAVVYRKVAWMVLANSCRCGAHACSMRQSSERSRVRNPAPLCFFSCFMFSFLCFPFFYLHARGGCVPCLYGCLYSSVHACCWWCCFWYTPKELMLVLM